MGLLDSITGGQGGYGGLLDMLMYQSPLNQPQQVAAQPQYDPMGTPFAAAPQQASDPFGAIPGFNAAAFAPQSPFTGGAAPVAGLQTGLPSLPQQSVAPAPQVAPTIDAPQNPINVGGYQMPRVGNMADFAPQAPTEFSAQSRAPQGPQTSPAFMNQDQAGAGFGDRLSAGLQNFASGGAILPALAGGISGLMTGNHTDKAGIAQQNMRAQYESLVPMLGPQKAMLAVMNPEAGKILLAQALEKKQYGFTKLDNDTVLRTDPLTGKADVAYNTGNQSNTMRMPDGSMATMPEGADPKTWRNEITKINADAAAGKKTEVQAKSEKFGNKMENAEKNLMGIQGEGTSIMGSIASGVPLGNYVKTAKYQQYEQAKNNFITALLRDESGAAIGTQEFTRYDRELFPQPGDSQSVITQKAEARRLATDAMKKSAGPGYKSPSNDAPKVRKYNPATGTIE